MVRELARRKECLDSTAAEFRSFRKGMWDGRRRVGRGEDAAGSCWCSEKLHDEGMGKWRVLMLDSEGKVHEVLPLGLRSA